MQREASRVCRQLARILILIHKKIVLYFFHLFMYSSRERERPATRRGRRKLLGCRIEQSGIFCFGLVFFFFTSDGELHGFPETCFFFVFLFGWCGPFAPFVSFFWSSVRQGLEDEKRFPRHFCIFLRGRERREESCWCCPR